MKDRCVAISSSVCALMMMTGWTDAVQSIFTGVACGVMYGLLTWDGFKEDK